MGCSPTFGLVVYLRFSKVPFFFSHFVCVCACAAKSVNCGNVLPWPIHSRLTTACQVSLEHHCPLHMTLLNIFTSSHKSFAKRHETQFLASVCTYTWEDRSNPWYQIGICWGNVWRKEECRYIWLLMKSAPLCAWDRGHRANRACLNCF